MARDRVGRASHVAADGLSKAARDLRNRTRGVGSSVAHLVRRRRPADAILVERVRAALGRAVSHPHAIDVAASDGVVVLSGPVLTSEEPQLISTVMCVRGVRRVESHLALHETAGDIPALQGGPSHKPRQLRLDVRQRHWAPATRVLVGGTALAMIATASRRSKGSGLPLAAVGAVLLARAATNLELKRLFGAGARRRAIDVMKTINVDAPVERVFAFWDHFPNFPGFMRHVKEVRATRNPRQWHWTVSGPGEIPVEFDAVLTERIPNRVLAWKTVEGSAIGHAGLVRFDPTRRGGTRVQVRLSYNPPGGAIGHGLLALTGADPKSRLDEDLARMKTALETGRAPRDAAERRSVDLSS